MSRIDPQISLPSEYDAATLMIVLRQMAYQLNMLTEGVLKAVHNAYTAAPTGAAKTYNVGDFVRKSNPAEAGGAGSKYIIVGWICTVSGAPGTWRECRVLTGN